MATPPHRPALGGEPGVRPPAVPNPSGPPAPPYPVALEISRPEQLSRWLPLVKGLLAIPHYIVLVFLAIGAWFVLVYSFFAVLFTGRYPAGAFAYMTGLYRWSHRVNSYTYLQTDAYPPFTLADEPSYPVRLAIEYPQRIARWRPLVNWLLAVPAAIALWVLLLAAGFCAFIAFFAILFTRRFPPGLFDLVTVTFRWQARVNAYAYWMTEKYPPFVYA